MLRLILSKWKSDGTLEVRYSSLASPEYIVTQEDRVVAAFKTEKDAVWYAELTNGEVWEPPKNLPFTKITNSIYSRK